MQRRRSQRHVVIFAVNVLDVFVAENHAKEAESEACCDICSECIGCICSGEPCKGGGVRGTL